MKEKTGDEKAGGKTAGSKTAGDRAAGVKEADELGGKVIHVAFGSPRGAHLPIIDPPAAASPSEVPAKRERDAVTAHFSRRDVARLLGLTESRLASMDKSGIVSPSATDKGRRTYTFQDLIALRATLLLAKDVRLVEVKKAIVALRESLPNVERPLHELRLVSDGRRVVVRSDDGSFVPTTGQMVMDFEIAKLEEDCVRILRSSNPENRAKTAYDLYMRASSVDEDPERLEEAEALYQRAVELDPSLAIAFTNLGNVRFRKGLTEEAQVLYEKALALDERQPEAHYNLGYVKLERGDAPSAVDHFQRALERDPRFADAHFNLAIALEETGDRHRAKNHWQEYLTLEPKGAWADIARKRLGIRL